MKKGEVTDPSSASFVNNVAERLVFDFGITHLAGSLSFAVRSHFRNAQGGADDDEPNPLAT